MASGFDAKCQKGDCGYEWSLRKHPNEYARGVTCPECGTSRTEVFGPDGDPFDTSARPQQSPQPSQGQQQGQQSPPAQQQGRPPAPAQQGQQQGHVPAQQGQQGQAAPPTTEEAMGQGAALADALMVAGSNDPEKSDVAKARLAQGAASALFHWSQRAEKKAVEGRERAKSTSNDAIRQSNDYPSCPECSTQLTNVPDADEFACPGCGVMLEHVPPGQ